MSIRKATISITGVSPLLQNNPQMVDRFNPYLKRATAVNAKKAKRTDDDYREVRDIEVRAKIFFSQSIGIYVPSSWIAAAAAATAFKVGKISRAEMRGAFFTTEDEIKLNYRGMEKVQKPEDIVKNHDFRINLTLKQAQVRVVKAFPVFHDWHFTTDVEFDDKIIDPDALTRIFEHAAKYGGFGDFRPTYGRATARVSHE